jgi:hypothetical protein
VLARHALAMQEDGGERRMRRDLVRIQLNGLVNLAM